MKPVYVFFTLYYRQRCYGGSEEGGWWFTAMEAMESIKCKAKQRIIGNDYSFSPTKQALKQLRKQDKTCFLLPENNLPDHCEICSEKILHYNQKLGQSYC